ncbi:hypothetical protein AaE_011306 [Aphanomyces astaci]|uniref:Uncharacterized protein n=1 Tax=Aphanomyces astaci TaxID=112090 RepID=A0A6A4ZQW8_APHAT|nr:hypothetical protein AaE_011306 [Aphanomyces astaci]
MKAEPSSPIRPSSMDTSSVAALQYSPPRGTSVNVTKPLGYHNDENPALAKRKRVHHMASIDAMPRITPKTTAHNHVEGRSIAVRILVQPPRVWYRDQKGRRTVFCIKVGVVDQDDRLLSADHTPGGYFTATLLYENGNEVADKRIVELRKGAFFDSHASTASMEIRIADISKNHQNQKFRVRVDFLWPHVTVAAAVSDPIHVLSKHVLSNTPEDRDDSEPILSIEEDHSSSDDGTPIFRTPPINSPTTSPVVEGPRRPPTPPPTKMEEGDNISIGHGMSMTRWCSAAHRVLTQVEWSPFQDARSAIQFKCQWCFAVQPTLATAQHATGCLLKSLLTMIVTDPTDDRSEAPLLLPSSPAPLATKFEMAERLRTATNIYRPVPHYATTSTLKRPNAIPVVDDDDEHGKDLTLLSIGDLSAFAKSSTFDDALMLKSLSQVSVADDWRCANSPSSSSSPRRQFLMDDDSSLLSRFTDSTICASNTEAAVVAIGVFPLEGCDTGMPAFDGDWTLLGVYHMAPRPMVSIGHMYLLNLWAVLQ